MATTTMDQHAPGGGSEIRLHTWAPACVEDLRNHAAVSSTGLSMIYVVNGPQTRRGTPPPAVGANVVSAELWCMFIAAVINTLVF